MNKRKSGSVCINISQSIFQTRDITTDKEWYFIMIKKKLYQENRTKLNMHTSNNRILRPLNSSVFKTLLSNSEGAGSIIVHRTKIPHAAEFGQKLK